MIKQLLCLLPVLLLASCDTVDSTPSPVLETVTNDRPSHTEAEHSSSKHESVLTERLGENGSAITFDSAQLSQLTQRAELQESRGQLREAIETWNEIQLLIEEHYDADSWQATNVELARWNVQWRMQMTEDQRDQLRETEQQANFARSLSQQNRNVEARRAWSHATALARQVWPPVSHPLATYLTLEANSCGALGQFAEAIEKYREVLAIREKVAGHNHPDYVQALHGLGNLCRLSGQPHDAVRFLVHAADLSRQLWGADHIHYAAHLNSLGMAYHAIGDYEDTLQIFQQAAAIRHRRLGENHPSLAETQYNLGSIHLEIGEWDLAIAEFEKAYTIFSEQLGRKHHQTLMVMDSLSSAHTRMHIYPYAERLLRELHNIRLELFGAEHPDTVRTQFRLAVVLGNQGRYEEAEHLLLHVVEIQEHASPVEASALRKTLETYAALLQRTGRTEHAKELSARISSMATR